MRKVNTGKTAVVVMVLSALVLLATCDSPVGSSAGDTEGEDGNGEDGNGVAGELPSVEMVAAAYMTLGHIVLPAMEGDLDLEDVENVTVSGSIDEETGGEIEIEVSGAVINEEDGSTVDADVTVSVDYGEADSSITIDGEITFTDFEYGIELIRFLDATLYWAGDAVGRVAPNPPNGASGSVEIDGEEYAVTDWLHIVLSTEIAAAILSITTSVAFEDYPDWWDDELPDGILHHEIEESHHRVFFSSYATGEDTHAPVYLGHFDFHEAMEEEPYELMFDGSIEIENAFIGSLALNSLIISWDSSPPASPSTPPDSITGSITADDHTYEAESLMWLMDAVGLIELDQHDPDISGSFNVTADGAQDEDEWNDVTLFAAGDRSNEIAWGHVTDGSWHGTIERGTYDAIYAEVHYGEGDSGSWFSGEENPVATDFHVGSDPVDIDLHIDDDWIALGGE